ncbi:MAG: hypothetical protein D6681_11110 [Calditrichaeota bacterium]|nr:MAG: hypothetical protein D6681_11110 [Calditrichota bacterium]
MSNSHWMAELAAHYGEMRRRYPDERLIILFDVDGTIIDMRYMIMHVLQRYDRAHGTRFFRKLRPADITVHESRIADLLRALSVPGAHHEEILRWYDHHRWNGEVIFQAHQPFAGVLEVIRWFQLQPNTFVGLNTGLPESLREDTLKSLNRLGEEYKVHFSPALMHMNPRGWEQEVTRAKVEGIRFFQQQGYRVFAFFDNEPDNLRAVAEIDPDHEILLLHADTLFETRPEGMPSRVVQGNTYDLTYLIPESALPRHIQFVWHGVNDPENLDQFLASEITWGECDVRPDPIGSDLILRHDSFQETPLQLEEEWLSLEELLQKLHRAGKSVKIDLKAGGPVVEGVLEAVRRIGFSDDRLWFNGNVERLQEAGFRKLAAAHPGAILQCPVDFLAPLICSVPRRAREILDTFLDWGVNRFSISWRTENLRQFFKQMNEWDLPVNIYNVPDLEAFLRAVLMLPRSITADFNFPHWNYFGRGSGEGGRYHTR